MEKLRTLPRRLFCIYCIFILFLCYADSSSPAGNTSNNATNNSQGTQTLDCEAEEYVIDDVVFLNNSEIFLKTKNITVYSSHYQKSDGKLYVCLPDQQTTNKPRGHMNCTKRFEYNKHEYQLFPNGSVLLYGDVLLPGEYKFTDSGLIACDADDGTDTNNFKPHHSRLASATIYVGQIGSAISIIALIAHLSIFCSVPSLRNLPGYNLASLGVAFLLAYSFNLIGQIPQVLGLSCVISGVLQLNFFLAAFFWMNVLAFDVWRTLKVVTKTLFSRSHNFREHQFLWYSLYAWGCPFVLTAISLLFETIDGVPVSIKPHYSANNICFITGEHAKTIFFSVPAFTLFVINGYFFISSSMMVSSNVMKTSDDQNKEKVTVNHVLYLKLGLMMGITWLIGIIAVISMEEVIWLIHDFLNTLQGLFLFLLFTCSKKVLLSLKERYRANNSETSKQSSNTTKSDPV